MMLVVGVHTRPALIRLRITLDRAMSVASGLSRNRELQNVVCFGTDWREAGKAFLPTPYLAEDSVDLRTCCIIQPLISDPIARIKSRNWIQILQDSYPKDPIF